MQFEHRHDPEEYRRLKEDTFARQHAADQARAEEKRENARARAQQRLSAKEMEAWEQKYDRQQQAEEKRKRDQRVSNYDSTKPSKYAGMQYTAAEKKDLEDKRVAKQTFSNNEQNKAYSDAAKAHFGSRIKYATGSDGQKHSYYEKEDSDARKALFQSWNQAFDSGQETWDPSELFRQYGIEMPEGYGSYGSKTGTISYGRK